VAARFRAWVWGRSLAGISGSNPADSIDVCLLWVLCVVRYKSLPWADDSSRRVRPSVVCLSIISKPTAVEPWKNMLLDTCVLYIKSQSLWLIVYDVLSVSRPGRDNGISQKPPPGKSKCVIIITTWSVCVTKRRCYLCSIPVSNSWYPSFHFIPEADSTTFKSSVNFLSTYSYTT
jgi:hypothetical protein